MLCLSPSCHPVWYFSSHIQFPQSGPTALILSQWRPPVLAYKIDKEKEQTQTKYLVSVLTSSGIIVAVLWWGFPHDPSLPIYQQEWVQKGSYGRISSPVDRLARYSPGKRCGKKDGHSFECPYLLLISPSSLDSSDFNSYIKAVSLSPSSSQSHFSTVCPLVLRYCPSSVPQHFIHVQHTQVSCFVIYIVHISLAVGLQNLWQEQPGIYFPVQSSPTTPLGSNKIENKQSNRLKLEHKQRQHRWLTSPILVVSYHGFL